MAISFALIIGCLCGAVYGKLGYFLALPLLAGLAGALRGYLLFGGDDAGFWGGVLDG
jgi:hypothetical protein